MLCISSNSFRQTLARLRSVRPPVLAGNWLHKVNVFKNIVQIIGGDDVCRYINRFLLTYPGIGVITHDIIAQAL